MLFKKVLHFKNQRTPNNMKKSFTRIIVMGGFLFFFSQRYRLDLAFFGGKFRYKWIDKVIM